MWLARTCSRLARAGLRLFQVCMKALYRRDLKNPESRLFCGFRLFGLRKLPMEASLKSRGVLFTTSLRSATFSSRTLGWRTTDGQKFLTHQFTFLDPPIFLARKLILPTTSFKPAFWTHQCFRPSLEPPNRGKAKKLAVKFLGRAHHSFPNL